jgi:hypothetical protein
MIRIRRKPSPALIVAILALIVAMAGGAYAVTVPKKSVGPKQLKAGAVKTGKIADGAVTGAKIADGAVNTKKIADKAVTSSKFFLSAVSNQNIGNVAGGACTTFDVATPGIQATDHVLATPPPGYTDTFSLTADPNPAGNAVTLQLCNLFQGGGAADPDGGGGPYKVLVIR